MAAKDGGAQRFRDFSWDCYDKAFASTHMKNVLACYITINVVVDQLEHTLKVKIKDKFDAILVDKLKDQKITDKELISGIFGQFNSAFQSESKWIAGLSVKKVSDCIEFGIGDRCKY